MKKAFIIIAGVVVVLAAVLFWLAGSVGPDTAPTEMQSRDVPINAQ